MEFVDIALFIAYLLVLLAALGAIILPLVNALSNPKSLIKSGIGIVVLGVVFLIGWGVSGDEVTKTYIEFGITSDSSKVIGGVLITTYILGIFAVLSIAFTEINKIFK